MTEEYNGYRIVADSFSMYKVMNMGKGALPKSLQSAFTSQSFARIAIDSHLASKEVTNGKADGG